MTWTRIAKGALAAWAVPGTIVGVAFGGAFGATEGYESKHPVLVVPGALVGGVIGGVAGIIGGPFMVRVGIDEYYGTEFDCFEYLKWDIEKSEKEWKRQEIENTKKMRQEWAAKRIKNKECRRNNYWPAYEARKERMSEETPLPSFRKDAKP